MTQITNLIQKEVTVAQGYIDVIIHCIEALEGEAGQGRQLHCFLYRLLPWIDL